MNSQFGAGTLESPPRLVSSLNSSRSSQSKMNQGVNNQRNFPQTAFARRLAQPQLTTQNKPGTLINKPTSTTENIPTPAPQGPTQAPIIEMSAGTGLPRPDVSIANQQPPSGSRIAPIRTPVPRPEQPMPRLGVIGDEFTTPDGIYIWQPYPGADYLARDSQGNFVDPTPYLRQRNELHNNALEIIRRLLGIGMPTR